jgi:putative endonuclease
MKGKHVDFGYLAEEKTIIYFSNLRFELIAQRFKTKHGEIDIIMKKGKTLLFIEVKARNNENFQDCISPKQVKRNLAAAHTFLSTFEEFTNYELRYDVVLVGKNAEIIEVIENGITEDF